ncbi:MAG: hypothetical protein U0945_13150, partial [Flavobacterium sp.]|nr:hypothetical protein [Flavobacterium sp.]
MKKFVFAMIILGGYNLFIFCKNNKIPLPVDLLTTTPTLLLYGISASITALTIAATSCFSLLITTLLQDNEIYIKCFRKRKSTESNKETIKNALFNYLLLLLPTVTILAIYFTYFDEIKTIIPPGKLFYIYVAEVLLTSLIIGIYVSKKFNHISNSDRFKIYSSIFLIKIIWIYTLSFSAFWVKNI